MALPPIEDRCRLRDTHAFVVADTVDPLADKLLGIIADRRMAKVHRYLGESAGSPRVFVGLRVDQRSFSPITRLPRQGVALHLAGQWKLEGLALWAEDGSEQAAARRYHHPDKEWLGQRRNITKVELQGWPGSPSREDLITIEHWNEHGVGQETIVAFDDVDLIQELAWDIKGDAERQVHLWDEFCDFHGLHFEHPDHAQRPVCKARQSTRAEDLALLAYLAARVPATTGGEEES